MSTPDKPIIDPRFRDGDKYMDSNEGILERDPFGKWYAPLSPIPGFPQYKRIWVLSDHHLSDAELCDDGFWRELT
jgi:hypothetical protein